MRIVDLMIELVYPKRCIICGEILNYGYKGFMCSSCAENEKYADNINYKYIASKNCHQKAYFDDCICVYYYDYVKYAIEHFKFKGYKNDAKPLGYIMYHYGQDRHIFENIDFMVSVPIHEKRFKERGFNHAFELAKVIEKYTNIKSFDDILFRKKKTKPQYLLNIEERIENITDAFGIRNAEKIKDKRIMLIGDIFTTGGTINECAKVLKENGAKSVYVFELSCSSSLK